MAYVLSFDLGTGGARAGVWCPASRALVATGQAPYRTDYPSPGFAEQNPQDWLTALEQAARAALAQAGTTQIAAICVSTTSSTVALCTDAGQPVAPAILWMDCRATREASLTATSMHPVMALAGGSDAVEWLVPKAMWMARNRPEQYQAAQVICEALDFVNHHLTGDWAGSRMNAACKWNYDSAAHRFVPQLYAEFGVPDLADKLPARIVPVGDVIGPLRPAIAARLGISTSPVVVQGGIDAHMGMLGADAVAPGAMLIVGGTSSAQILQIDAPADLPGFWGPYPNALTDGHWLVEAGQVSAGSVLDWLSRDIFGLDMAGQRALIAQVAQAPARGDGLLTLDYWMGNRTPYRDGALRGAILGLTLGQGRADIYASAIDAVALGTANVLETLAGQGVRPGRIVIAGGICNNPAWLQATIDAIGQPVDVVQGDNLTLVGGAVAAARALGHYPDLISAARACVAPMAQHRPRPDAQARYGAMLPMYRQATQALTPVLHALAAQQQASSGAST